MDHQVGDAQLVTALDLDDHGIDRLVPRALSGLARLIRYDVWATGSLIPVFSAPGGKRRPALRPARVRTLAAVLGENLNGLESRGVRRFHGAMAAADDRHVNAELARRRFGRSGLSGSGHVVAGPSAALWPLLAISASRHLRIGGKPF